MSALRPVTSPLAKFPALERPVLLVSRPRDALRERAAPFGSRPERPAEHPPTDCDPLVSACRWRGPCCSYRAAHPARRLTSISLPCSLAFWLFSWILRNQRASSSSPSFSASWM